MESVVDKNEAFLPFFAYFRSRAPRFRRIRQPKTRLSPLLAPLFDNSPIGTGFFTEGVLQGTARCFSPWIFPHDKYRFKGIKQTFCGTGRFFAKYSVYKHLIAKKSKSRLKNNRLSCYNIDKLLTPEPFNFCEMRLQKSERNVGNAIQCFDQSGLVLCRSSLAWLCFTLAWRAELGSDRFAHRFVVNTYGRFRGEHVSGFVKRNGQHSPALENIEFEVFCNLSVIFGRETFGRSAGKFGGCKHG